MRYVLIDRFLGLEPGKRARAVKCITRGEEDLRDLETYPSSLVLESLLQTGGILARASTGFTRMSVLGKVERAEFPGAAHHGDRLVLDVEATLSRPEGTLCEGTATVDGEVVARASFMIVFVPEAMAPPADPARAARYARLMSALGVSKLLAQESA